MTTDFNELIQVIVDTARDEPNAFPPTSETKKTIVSILTTCQKQGYEPARVMLLSDGGFILIYEKNGQIVLLRIGKDIEVYTRAEPTPDQIFSSEDFAQASTMVDTFLNRNQVFN